MSEYREREVETPGLDRFLSGCRPFTPAERREALRRVFAPEIERAPEELVPYRIMVGWRILRRIAQFKGQLGDDERMEEAFEVEPSPWDTPARPQLRPGMSSPTRRRTLARVLLLHDEGEGLPLLPPEDPDLAARWCDAATLVAKDLGIETYEEGLLGIQGVLDDPVSAWVNFPTPEQILAFEELVIIEATDVVVTAGERNCIQHFRDTYCLTRPESLQVVKLARQRAHEEMAGTVEEDRALLAAYWKDYIERARREPAGLTHEARGYKELARVLGVTRTEPENAMEAFTKTVAAIAAEKRAAQLAEEKRRAAISEKTGEDIVQPARPPVEAEDAEFRTIEPTPEDPADREALEAFDKENA